MKKKVLATACLMSLAVSQAAFADDYVTGDSRYAAPDFQEQKQEREAGVIKDKSKKKKQAESAEPMPITLWSDSATYDQGSGDFFAEGNVKIVQSSHLTRCGGCRCQPLHRRYSGRKYQHHS